ncbi:EntF Non-ribosomal peptide synthetase module [Pyrenophora tritici-repentis]|nr:EntF Non-ribosomal peptide synthetase module [Pyrenophora tritici-repentis]
MPVIKGKQMEDYEILLIADINKYQSRFVLRYATSTLCDAQALNISSNIVVAIRTLAKSSGKTIKDISLISEKNWKDIGSWNAMIKPAIQDCVHHIVERQAALRGNGVAVAASDGSLTYKELNHLATILGVYLNKLGCERGTFVPLCLDKSLWAIVAMVGILKSGAACVPMDPTHPTDRLAQIIRETKANVVIVSNRYKSRFSVRNSIVLAMPFFQELGTQGPYATGEHVSVQPHDTAFLMFTSGSVAKPKGVILEHAAIYSSLEDLVEVMNITSSTRSLQFASFTFNVSLADIFAPMLRGACVCIPSEHHRLNNLPEFIRHFNVSDAWFTSTTLAQLSPTDVPGLKRVTIGGESITRDQLAVWAPETDLNITYGTTETAAWCLFHPSLSPDSDPYNLGYAAGGAVWITDPSDPEELAPVGSVGEVLIEGPALARGYLNDPEKTAESFLNAPEWLRRLRPGGQRRVYRTRDLARYNSNGSIEFVGREATRAKLRGHRIEVGEVEMHIKQLSRSFKDVVAEVVVPATSHSGGLVSNPILVVFIWSGTGAAPKEASQAAFPNLFAPTTEAFQSDAAHTLARLRDILPGYMVPTTAIPLNFIPLTTSGKTNRRQLREQASALSREQLNAFLSPESIVRPPTKKRELVMRKLWAELLGIPELHIGVDSNFFALGGDSIAAMKLVSMARKQSLTISVMNIFEKQHLFEISESATPISEFHGESAEPFSLLGNFEDKEKIILEAAHQCAIQIDAIEDMYPCTALQEGLMALTLKKPGAYMVQVSYELPPDLDIAKFQRAWIRTAARLPILRTRIILTDCHEMFQAVVRQNLECNSENDLDRYLEADGQRPMHLGSPLVRLALVEQADSNNPKYLVLTMHHSIFDGWSFPLILNQVETDYNDGAPPENKNFNMFMKYVYEMDKSACDRFWTSSFTDLNAQNFPEAATKGYIAAPDTVIQHRIPLKTTQRSSITLSTMLRLAWAIVIADQTQSDDVVFGTTVTGRQGAVADIEKIIGPTIATVPLRIKLDMQKTVQDLLQALQEYTTSMIPFEQRGLQNISKLGLDSSAACRFQNLLVIQPSPQHMDTEIFKREWSNSGTSAGFYDYPLTLSCQIYDKQIEIRAIFDAHLLPEARAQRILEQFSYILQNIRDMPQKQLKELDLICPQEELQLMLWNGSLPDKVDCCAHDLILENCRTNPTAEAVCSWDGTFTYQELDELSSAVAAHLVTQGLQPETFVCLCFNKSKWTTVGILAVMKAGGAFVLLEPSFPLRRLEQICSNTGSRIILSSAEHALLSASLAPTVIVLDDGTEQWNKPYNTFEGPRINPKNALYAIYTSGSTGKPKGVVIEHASFCTAAKAQLKAWGMDQQSRVIQFSSYAFDASVMEHLSTLVAGGCVCVISEMDRRDNLGEASSQLRANWACFTPFFARHLIPEHFPTLRTILLAGETVSEAEIELWADYVQLKQTYGPAECSLAAVNQPQINTKSDPRNVGYPGGCSCWVVDQEDHQKLVPIMCVGELVIEGPIVGRGYLGEEEQTRAAFIQPPNWIKRFRQRNPTGPFYKTGDLVQFQYDGTVRYIGRKDTQVKLHGQRIELGEVEYHAAQYLGKAEVVAEIVKFRNTARSVLAVFVKYADKAQERVTDLPSLEFIVSMTEDMRSQSIDLVIGLRNSLPKYMIPKFVFPIAHVPLTATGKIDRKRLREQVSLLPEDIASNYTMSTSKKQKPLTFMERNIMNLFSQVLKIDMDCIGVDESFLDLGGDSILALALVEEARKKNWTFTVSQVLTDDISTLAAAEDLLL